MTFSSGLRVVRVVRFASERVSVLCSMRAPGSRDGPGVAMTLIIVGISAW